MVQDVARHAARNSSAVDIMSNPYWLHPVVPDGGERGRKMGVATIPPVREHLNPFLTTFWPIRPVQQHAVESFQMNEPTRASHHTR